MEGATVPCGCKKPACLWNRADLKMPREQRQNHVSDLYQAVPGAITKCHRLGGFSQKNVSLPILEAESQDQGALVSPCCSSKSLVILD